MGARLGAREKESIWMMKPTFYLLYIVRGPKDSVWKENMKEKQGGNFKEKKTTTTTTAMTRAQQLLSMLGKNITKNVFLSIRIMKNLPFMSFIYHTLLEDLWIVGRIKKRNLTEEIPTARTQ